MYPGISAVQVVEVDPEADTGMRLPLQWKNYEKIVMRSESAEITSIGL